MKTTLTIAVVLSLCLLTSCTQPDESYKVLSDQGYTNIETTGYKAFACSKDDTFHTGFTATSVAGKPVSGTVCSGWLKGSTIRID